jgi:starvation-inducible outer membrane lipoprotein
MENHMQHLPKALIGVSVLTLAACTTAPATEQPAPAAAAAPAIAAKVYDETNTGSRIPKKGGGDRTVKTVGSRDARDSFDNQAKPLDRQ